MSRGSVGRRTEKGGGFNHAVPNTMPCQSLSRRTSAAAEKKIVPVDISDITEKQIRLKIDTECRHHKMQKMVCEFNL